MSMWRDLERWITANNKNNDDFTNWELASDLQISTYHAGDLIQAYQDAQRKGFTAYILTRRGRTYSAYWHVGSRQADSMGMCTQELDDVRNRFLTAVAPTLTRFEQLNPRSAAYVQAAMASFEISIDQLERLLANQNGNRP